MNSIMRCGNQAIDERYPLRNLTFFPAPFAHVRRKLRWSRPLLSFRRVANKGRLAELQDCRSLDLYDSGVIGLRNSGRPASSRPAERQATGSANDSSRHAFEIRKLYPLKHSAKNCIMLYNACIKKPGRVFITRTIYNRAAALFNSVGWFLRTEQRQGHTSPLVRS